MEAFSGLFSNLSGTATRAGGVAIVYVGILGVGFFGLCIGAILGKMLTGMVTGSPEDVRLGQGVYVGCTKQLIGVLVQGSTTLGFLIAFLYLAHYCAKANFLSFLIHVR